MGKHHKSRAVLARNVRRLRRAKGWSQDDLAAEADIRQALVSEIESGSTNPKLSSIEKIAGALGVKVSDLLTC